MPYFVHSEGGFGHTNEDEVQVRAHGGEYGVMLCALADGMGGQAGGGLAAHLAVLESLGTAESFTSEQLRDEVTWGMIVGAADNVVNEVDTAGYATLVCLGVVGDLLVGASCGDSAALLLDGRGQQHILTDNQCKHPPLGSGGALPVAFSAPLGRGWQIVVMSDGVWKYLGWETIIELAWEKRGLDLVLALRERAAAQSGGKLWDDWSVAVITD